jgi:SAM-dependent methyltransferase
MTTSDPGWVTPRPDDLDEWTRWESSPIQQIDFAVHIHYLRQYLQREHRVLEVGAGAGRFTREIADVADRVVVVDISEDKLQRNRRNAEALGYAASIEEWRLSDMRDLSKDFHDDEFDAVLCFGGPLSYVFDLREKALRELVRVARPGGLLLLSARSLWGVLHEHLPQILNMVDPRMNREIIATGDLGPTQVGPMDRFWHAYRASEFRDFVAGAGCEILTLSASNCLTSTWQQVLASWRDDAKIWNHLIELEIEACREPGCLDMGAHILAIARKL